MYVGLGYAVVASDYAGLGTRFPNAAFDLRSNAVDAVAAAHCALPQLGTNRVVIGQGQGSPVAVAVAEAGSCGPNFLGAIGISGLAEPQELFERVAQGPSYSDLVFLAGGSRPCIPCFESTRC